MAVTTISILMVDLNRPVAVASEYWPPVMPLVDIGVKHIGGCAVHRVLHQEDLLVAGVQKLADLHDQHQDNGAADGGQRDMPHQLPTACAVDLGSLIQLHIHTGQRRQIDDGAVAGLFPDILADDQRGERAWGR